MPAVSRHLDPFAAFVQLLRLVGRARLPLSAIDDRIPRSYVVRTDVVTAWARKASVMRRIRELAERSAVDDGHGGVRISYGDRRWVFIAADPTEAVTHIWAEGESATDADELLATWADHVTEVLG